MIRVSKSKGELKTMGKVDFLYRYRDAFNFGMSGAYTFANPDNLSVEVINRRLNACCDSENLFIADQVGIEELFSFNDGESPVSAEDHCFHEFICVEETDDRSATTAIDHRSITAFLDQFAREANAGWKVFDPAERERSRSMLAFQR